MHWVAQKTRLDYHPRGLGLDVAVINVGVEPKVCIFCMRCCAQQASHKQSVKLDSCSSRLRNTVQSFPSGRSWRKPAAMRRGGEVPRSIRPRLLLLLDVDDDDAQRCHQAQSLDAQEPEQQPEEEHDHRFHYFVPKKHVAESQPPQTLIEHPKQSSHSLTVIQARLSGGLFHCAPPGTGITGAGGSLSQLERGGNKPDVDT